MGLDHAAQWVRRVSQGRLSLETVAGAVYLVDAASGERACLLTARTAADFNGSGESNGCGGDDRLSEREEQVLDMLGAGADMHEIALSLGVSVKTIETYRARIKRKLGIRNRRRLLTYAVERRILRSNLPTEDGSGARTLDSADSGHHEPAFGCEG